MKRTYEQLFREIEKQTEFRFAFSNSKLDSNQKIKLDVTDETLEKILDKALPEGIAYEIIDCYVVILNAFEKTSIAERQQQQRSVSGKVTDFSGLPLPGVTVVVKGTTQGTVTNADGNYTITNVPENATLVFSFVGMRTQEVVVGSQTIINVAMEEETIGIEEVVAVGYGTQKRENLTGSVSVVGSEELENRGLENTIDALQGTTSNIQNDHSWLFSDLSPIINEVRRERRVEPAGGGFRWDDLARWRAHETFKGKRPLGAKYSDEEYPDIILQVIMGSP